MFPSGEVPKKLAQSQFLPQTVEDQSGPPQLVLEDVERALGLGAQDADRGTVLDELGDDAFEIPLLQEFIEAPQRTQEVLADLTVLPTVLDDVQILVGSAVSLDGLESDEYSTRISVAENRKRTPVAGLERFYESGVAEKRLKLSNLGQG